MQVTNGTIEIITESKICAGCGTCASICPRAAIGIVSSQNASTYVPQINHEKCNNCGICLAVCPSCSTIGVHETEISGREPEDFLIGNHVSCYTGYATDHRLRYDSSSGGVVTALLLFALAEGIIDGALVTKMNKNNPLAPEVYLARTPEDILSASKSKYCPVPLNLALKELLHEEGKFAIVGLPCHINGARKAQLYNESLNNKISLHIGLFCGHTVNFLGTEFILSKLGIDKGDVEGINYRGEGRPSMLTILLKNGKKTSIPTHSGLFGLLHQTRLFTPMGCMTCLDQTCEPADISVGDAWLSEFANENVGTSIVVSRNGLGEKVLKSAAYKHWIDLNKTTQSKVVFSQRSALCFKKTSKEKLLGIRFLRRNGLNYNTSYLKPRPLFQFFVGLICLNIFISENRILRNLLKYVPLKILRLHHTIISILENTNGVLFWNMVATS